jgi:opacity protein-like surface antigen
LANLYYDVDTGTEFSPYVGFGLGINYLKTSVNLDGVYTNQDTETFLSGRSADSAYDLTWQLSAGVSYLLADNWNLDVGYRYSDLGKLDTLTVGKIIKIEDSGLVAFSTTKSSIELKSHEFLVGLRYSF